MNRIYTSHLDNDTYKFHMGAFFWHFHKGVPTTYAYKCRDSQIDLSFIYDELCEQIETMSDITLTKDQQKWLFENTRVTQNYLINFLSKFRFNPKQVNIKKIKQNPGLDIRINGPVEEASLWEIPLMSTISELYFKNLYGSNYDEMFNQALKDLDIKIGYLMDNVPSNFSFSDFGTRRRFSKKFQEITIKKLVEFVPQMFIGTSNVEFARKFKIKAVGTQAHECFMLYQSIVHPSDSQKKFLRDWIDFYRGWNGIALSDTLGDEKWNKDFTKDLMVDYIGQRHDSGDPFSWGRKRIDAYKIEGIDPKDKTLLFSDSLDFEKAIKLTNTFKDEINITHGIGTYLTNNIPSVPTHKALNQVIKMVWANGRPVAKFGNDPLKTQCEDEIYLNYLKHITAKNEN